MPTEKKEYSASDAQPVVLYAKTDANGRMAYPVVANSLGQLNVRNLVKDIDWDRITPIFDTLTDQYVIERSLATTATITITYTTASKSTISNIVKVLI